MRNLPAGAGDDALLQLGRTVGPLRCVLSLSRMQGLLEFERIDDAREFVRRGADRQVSPAPKVLYAAPRSSARSVCGGGCNGAHGCRRSRVARRVVAVAD